MYYEKQISSQNCWILVVIVHLNGYNGARRMSQVPCSQFPFFFNLRLPKIIQSMRWKWDKFSPRFNLVAFSPRGSLGGWVAAARREQHHVSGHLTLPTMFNLYFSVIWQEEITEMGWDEHPGHVPSCRQRLRPDEDRRTKHSLQQVRAFWL